MAMFNFELGGKEEPRKMRSYIDIDSAGKPTARIYADEYDSVKANPDFAPFLTSAGRSVAREQTVDDMIAEEKMSDVERRIESKRREAVAADLQATRAEAEDNLYSGPDLFGLSLGRKTFKQKAETKKRELQALLEEQAGYQRTPEVSAPVEAVGSEATEQAAPIQPVAPSATVRVKSPSGKIANVPANVWSKDSKKYIEQGYQLMP